jgi:thiol-disulfide isomerase/thioredoxin
MGMAGEPAKARRRRRATIGLVAGVVALVAAFGVFVFGRGGAPSGTSTAPTAWALPALRGDGNVRLADFRGRPTVVNFFASWCTACDFELPGFADVSAKLKGRVAFVGVDSLETGDPNLMPTRHDITWWPLARDVGGANGSGLHDALGGGSSMPVTAFYDAGGKLLRVERSALPEDALKQELAQLYGITVG